MDRPLGPACTLHPPISPAGTASVSRLLFDLTLNQASACAMTGTPNGGRVQPEGNAPKAEVLPGALFSQGPEEGQGKNPAPARGS